MENKIILATCMLLALSSDLQARAWNRSVRNIGATRSFDQSRPFISQVGNAKPSTSGIDGVGELFNKARDFLGTIKQTANEVASTANDVQKTQSQIQNQYQSIRNDSHKKDPKTALDAQLMQIEQETKTLRTQLEQLERRKKIIRQQVQDHEIAEARQQEYKQQKELKKLRAGKALHEMRQKHKQRSNEQRLKTLEKRREQSQYGIANSKR